MMCVCWWYSRVVRQIDNLNSPWIFRYNISARRDRGRGYRQDESLPLIYTLIGVSVVYTLYCLCSSQQSSQSMYGSRNFSWPAQFSEYILNSFKKYVLTTYIIISSGQRLLNTEYAWDRIHTPPVVSESYLKLRTCVTEVIILLPVDFKTLFWIHSLRLSE